MWWGKYDFPLQFKPFLGFDHPIGKRESRSRFAAVVSRMDEF